MRLILKVPPDASFLSSALYEGVAYLLSVAGGRVTPNYIELPDDAFARAFREVAKDEERLSGVKIASTRNDRKSINNLLKSLGVNPEDFWPEKKKGGKASIVPYGNLIGKVAEVSISKPEVLNRPGTVELSVRLKGKEIFVGSGEPFLSLALFKSCDKYGSLRVWEFTSLGEQVRQKLSINAALTCLLGLYSSYVGRVGNTNLFLFLDPSEVVEVLSTSMMSGKDPSEALRWRINVRNTGKEVITDFLEAAVVPPAVLTRLALSVKFAEALEGTDIEALRLRLVRVDEEGNIYKVYGDMPIEARREPLLKGRLSEKLSEHVSKSSPLMRCVQLFVWKGQGRGVRLCEENDHVLKAVDALYRFVALRDPTALAEYARHLRDAADVLEAAVRGGESGATAWRMNTYRRWVAGLDYAVRELMERVFGSSA